MRGGYLSIFNIQPRNQDNLRGGYLSIFNTSAKFSLTQFRVSSHDLNLDVGRYTNTTRNQRLCTNCSMNILECEYHVLLVCPKYRDLRMIFFRLYYCHWPACHKFESLLCQNLHKKNVSLKLL